MIGAIAGDIIGSRFEFNNHRSKIFRLFSRKCFATDDSIMTLAIAKAVMDWDDHKGVLSNLAVRYMRDIGQPYPNCGYGGRFLRWIYSDDPKPYGSFGNGAAMRISPVAYVANSLEQVKVLSRLVTTVTHNHPEGIKGAEAVAVATYMALHDASKQQIRHMIQSEYYELDFTLDEIRPTYKFNETCQETVPQAIQAFMEASSYEDAIRNAISIGGDSDTVAAITGAIAGAYYGVPYHIVKKSRQYLDARLLAVYDMFVDRYIRNK